MINFSDDCQAYFNFNGRLSGVVLPNGYKYLISELSELEANEKSIPNGYSIGVSAQGHNIQASFCRKGNNLSVEGVIFGAL